jgi:monoamine oxidase
MGGTRREFLWQVAGAGGYRATYLTMQAMGLIGTAAAAEPLAVEKGAAHGTKIVILGAGVAGLSAAYGLGKAGYDVAVLEARDRVGGRNFTIRRGTRLDMTDGSRQVCEFDQNLYFNAGPARIPSAHQAVLGDCRELGVALEVLVNTSRDALLHNPTANGGKPVEMRQAINDARGEIAELLAKAVNRGALDEELTAADRERMAAFLRTYGDLSPDLVFKGSARSGYKTLPGAGDQVGVVRDPIPLSGSSTSTCGPRCCSRRASISRPPCSSPSAAWTEFRWPLPESSERWFACRARPWRYGAGTAASPFPISTSAAVSIMRLTPPIAW